MKSNGTRQMDAAKETRAFAHAFSRAARAVRTSAPRYIAPRNAAGERIVSCSRRLDSSWRDGASVELERELEAFTVDVMGSLVFGDDWAEVGQSTRALVRASREVAFRAANPLAPLLWRLPTPVNRRFDHAYLAFRSNVDTLIARRRAAAAPGDDLLARLISASGASGDSLTDA